jgi:hypothetical protein
MSGGVREPGSGLEAGDWSLKAQSALSTVEGRAPY